MDYWVYIVLLGAVLLVYALLLPKDKPAAEQPSGVVQEIEQTLDHFMDEMDEENKELVKLIADAKHEQELTSSKLQHKVEQLEKQQATIERLTERLLQLESRISAAPSAAVPEAASAAAPPAAAQPAADHAAPEQHGPPADSGELQAPARASIKDRFQPVFELQQQGKSMDAIAKKLGMTKGEVQLIVQLASKEERQRV